MWSTPVADNDWSLAITIVRQYLEFFFKGAGKDITILDSPAVQLAQLPDGVGGDPTRWATLEKSVVDSTLAFLVLLQVKAQFLMLPQAIVRAMDPLRVKVSEQMPIDPESPADQEIKAKTIWDEKARTVEMQIPGASTGLVRTGYAFGRKAFAVPPVEDFVMLDTIYHELTHAWFRLREFYDADPNALTLWDRGVLAYLSAKGVNGTDFSDRPGQAFSEAAAYYVGDRIHRWLTALDDLDFLWRSKPSNLDSAMLETIKTAYNHQVDIYGIVNHEALREPPLSPELRDEINAKLLDGLPLTMRFEDTKLAALSDTIRNR